MYSNNVNISLEGEIENQLQNDVTRFQLLHNITTNDRWLINTNNWTVLNDVNIYSITGQFALLTVHRIIPNYNY